MNEGQSPFNRQQILLISNSKVGGATIFFFFLDHFFKIFKREPIQGKHSQKGPIEEKRSPSYLRLQNRDSPLILRRRKEDGLYTEVEDNGEGC